MRPRKTRTATHETEITNSYMSPHGTRCTARPRVTTPVRCRATPAVVRTRAIRTRRPGGTSVRPRWPLATAPLPAGPPFPASLAPGPLATAPPAGGHASAVRRGAVRPVSVQGTGSGPDRRGYPSAHAGPGPRDDGTAPPEGEVSRERDHRQRVQHHGDDQEM